MRRPGGDTVAFPSRERCGTDEGERDERTATTNTVRSGDGDGVMRTSDDKASQPQPSSSTAPALLQVIADLPSARSFHHDQISVRLVLSPTAKHTKYELTSSALVRYKCASTHFTSFIPTRATSESVQRKRKECDGPSISPGTHIPRLPLQNPISQAEQ